MHACSCLSVCFCSLQQDQEKLPRKARLSFCFKHMEVLHCKHCENCYPDSFKHGTPGMSICFFCSTSSSKVHTLVEASLHLPARTQDGKRWRQCSGCDAIILAPDTHVEECPWCGGPEGPEGITWTYLQRELMFPPPVEEEETLPFLRSSHFFLPPPRLSLKRESDAGGEKVPSSTGKSWGQAPPP